MPHTAATVMSRRSFGLVRAVWSACMAVRALPSDRPHQDAGALHQRHDVKEDHQRAARDRDGDRTRAPGALLRLGEDDAVVLLVVARIGHDGLDAHAVSQASSPPHPRSTSSTAYRRKRYRIEKANMLRQARSAGEGARKTCTASSSMIAPVMPATTP